MARNEEKAQSMLYRFREAQAAELGLISRKKEKRPGMASSVNTVGECEKWRRQVLSEISRLVTKIQDVGLSDYQVRDINDNINKLLREKYHWERRIRELGGGNYSRAPTVIDKEGREVPGNRGYKYFGRAKDLPGVRELFEQEAAAAAPEPQGRSITEIYKHIDAEYYGYRDEEDGLLLEYEKELEKEWLEEALQHTPPEKPKEMEIDDDYQGEAPVPSQKEVEQYLVEQRRKQLMEKYVSSELAKSEEETKELTGRG